MFIDVTFWSNDAAEEARRIINEWQKEHDRYYGTPAGQVHGAGYEEIPVGGSWLTSGGNYHAVQIIPAPDHPVLRDNLVTEGVRLTYHGRRHGMRAEIRNLLRAYWSQRMPIGSSQVRETHRYATREPDWLPWETLDHHHREEEAHV